MDKIFYKMPKGWKVVTEKIFGQPRGAKLIRCGYDMGFLVTNKKSYERWLQDAKKLSDPTYERIKRKNKGKW